MTSSLSKREKSSAHIWRAWLSRVYPRRAPRCLILLSGSCPTCQSPIPAESMKNSSSLPASATIFFITASAAGERQILPRQMKSSFCFLYSILSVTYAFKYRLACEIHTKLLEYFLVNVAEHHGAVHLAAAKLRELLQSLTTVLVVLGKN